jgi:hypothetical protein
MGAVEEEVVQINTTTAFLMGFPLHSYPLVLSILLLKVEYTFCGAIEHPGEVTLGAMHKSFSPEECVK